MKKVGVALGDRSYEILIGRGLIGSLLRWLQSIEPAWAPSQIAILTDDNVDPLYGDTVAKEFLEWAPVGRLVVPAGEQSKSWEVAGDLLERVAELGLHRHDLIVTLGGGVVSDLGGFLASTYLRGIRLIHVPTSLLGQVDAAIGGKTGVNLTAGKNLAGAFYQPRGVVCDVEVLLSLPKEELISGLAEVVKYGLCFEPKLLDHFNPHGAPTHPGGESNRFHFQDPAVLEDLVFTSAKIKARVVAGDETDRGDRIFLNYGHTFGHALEAVGDYKRFTHGSAISVGMMFAANLALQIGLLDPAGVTLHDKALSAAGLPVRAAFDPGQVKAAWGMDKKRETKQRWVLLESIGSPVIRDDIGETEIAAAMKAVLV
ncbi:MAG: 3-dehydroquinate synthase [Actinomycetota bacterium]